MNLPETLPAALRAAILERGYENLTEVQSAATAPELEGRDLLVSARTGSGKTVAFGLAIANELLAGEETFLIRASAPLGLIIAPTRELALQVARELRWLYANANAEIATCVGGMDMRDERRALERGAHIVVGTPGRLSDHINRGSLDTSEIRAVVLDEADEMLDMGFREELEHILEDTPADRRTLMFSATVPKGIAALASRYQKDALRITTASDTTAHADIAYEALMVAPGDEENAIVNIVRHSDTESAIVFCSTRAAVNHLVTRLGNRGFSVVALSGEFSQKERANALSSLRSGRARVCIATDVAARGLDLPKLDLVIHADLPRDPATLLHRSGRTGRAGRKGISTLIVAPKARRRVERLLQDAKVEARWARPPSADDVTARDDARLLADTALTNPMVEKEEDLVSRLMAEHTPEQIAAAFIRKARAGRSAPEDLREVDDRPARKPREDRGEREWQDRPERAPRERRDWSDREPREPREPRARRERASIDGAVWIAINVGRKKNADPKWLLPMLCKAGGIDRDQIGQIRINSGNTHVELTPEGAERLFEHAENGRLEGSLQAFPLDGVPEIEDAAPPPRRERRPEGRSESRSEDRPPRFDRAERPERREPRERKSDWNPAERPARSSSERPDWKDRSSRAEKPAGKRYDGPREEGRSERPAKPAWAGNKDKPSFTKGPGKSAGKPSGKPAGKGKPGGKSGPPKGPKGKSFQGLKKPRA
ncbi:DEAD/DEAH box helicase [Hyphomonas polymorpha PS728]|uniref:DEAD/DEAH box helicase n=1 Tax=Hyphomonas polymorpha PS728 TaxID=1280954 RepID=A0A062VKN6_9PROT|nr:MULTISPECIES: DEAD/DEAH box helicase [Hyphomonas]AXE63061.1 ATP-dependent RNA helicase [Hyphomonas sp. CACIAM 19H1]KDA00229.1 DEAD/DEAH box helicase [Hyphomonas polymorpha PS728]